MPLHSMLYSVYPACLFGPFRISVQFACHCLFPVCHCFKSILFIHLKAPSISLVFDFVDSFGISFLLLLHILSPQAYFSDCDTVSYLCSVLLFSTILFRSRTYFLHYTSIIFFVFWILSYSYTTEFKKNNHTRIY